MMDRGGYGFWRIQSAGKAAWDRSIGLAANGWFCDLGHAGSIIEAMTHGLTQAPVPASGQSSQSPIFMSPARAAIDIFELIAAAADS
jgi:hypothetical protein